MLRSLLICSLLMFGGLVFDTSDAEAGRWRRCRGYRSAYYGRSYYRPHRVYRPYSYSYGPRVRLGVGIGFY